MLRLDIEGVTAEEAKGYILAGLKTKSDAIQAQIDQVNGVNQPTSMGKSTKALVRERLSQKPSKTPEKGAKKKGKMSAAGRAAIIAAQKKRWAKIKKAAKLAKAAQANADGQTDGNLADYVGAEPSQVEQPEAVGVE